MYCPKCATENVESARFCRACRANLSLVPRALSGDLPGERRDKTDDGIVNVLSAANAENRISMPRSATNTNQLTPQEKYESLAPPSVTEGTTRNMDPIPETPGEQLNSFIFGGVSRIICYPDSVHPG